MKNNRFSNIMMILGVSLIVISVCILIGSVIFQKVSASNARNIVIQMRQLMPNTWNATLDDRVNTIMPSMQIDGKDFCGIMEIPMYNTTLPVGSSWKSKTLGSYPCRFTGSIYDRTLIVGGSDNPGQFDFMKQISTGDRVYFTDMTGGCYSYKVTNILITTDVSSEKLMALEGDLVFFAKSTYSLNYTVVICQLGH